MRNRCVLVCARSTGHERVRARGRRRLSHLFDVCARRGSLLRRVSLARPRAEGTQRDGRLVAPPRRVCAGLSRPPRDGQSRLNLAAPMVSALYFGGAVPPSLGPWTAPNAPLPP